MFNPTLYLRGSSRPFQPWLMQNLDARTRHHRISEAVPQLRQLVFSFFLRSQLTFKTVATILLNRAVLRVIPILYKDAPNLERNEPQRHREASAPLRLRDLFAQRLPLGEATGATQRRKSKVKKFSAAS
ncbi:hypothetical protein [Nostoc favosum]|uniref:Transposase n=1 Tax=Nostoc favosum CHAB5714 TaxID=2780399 RepID=A0ABS8IGV8_9NOSO|nr:hypothetical protein [Nostoc favosum]MCC5602737.1 hypothetical protein [Nostoc favosum CHAB5714]